MRRSWWWLAAALALAGCGDDERASEPKVPELALERILPFNEVELGRPTRALVRVSNVGTANTGELVVELHSAASSVGRFELVPDSGCVGERLRPGTNCGILVELTSMALGEAMTMVRFIDPLGGGAVLDVPLSTTVRPRRGVTLTFAGTGQGVVRVTVGGQTTVCRRACNVPAAIGAQVTLKADTPSLFGAYTGACSASTSTCTFTAQDSNPVAVRFDAEPRERRTLLFPEAVVRSVDFDAAGNLVVGTSTYVYKFSRNGDELWKVLRPGQARVGAGGNIFVRNGDATTILDSAGALVRVVATVAGGCASEPNPMARTWAPLPDGGLAIQGPTSLILYNADGTVRFTSPPIGPACRGPLAVDSNGRVYTGIENVNAEPTDLLVFEASGTAAPSVENAAPQYHLALAARNGRLAIASSGHSYVSLRTLGASAANTNVSDPDYVDHGVAIDDDGDVASVLALREDTSVFATGAVVRRYSPTMTQRWSLTKPVFDDPIGLETTGVTPFDVAIDDQSGDLAIGGRYFSPTFDGGWVQIFAEP